MLLKGRLRGEGQGQFQKVLIFEPTPEGVDNVVDGDTVVEDRDDQGRKNTEILGKTNLDPLVCSAWVTEPRTTSSTKVTSMRTEAPLNLPPTSTTSVGSTERPGSLDGDEHKLLKEFNVNVQGDLGYKRESVLAA